MKYLTDIDVANTFPGAIASGLVRIFGKKFAGRIFLAFKDVSGIEEVIQASFAYSSYCLWIPLLGSATVPAAIGWQAMSILGTATARGLSSTSLVTRLKRLGYTSAATAAAFCGHFSTTTGHFIGNGAGLSGFHYVCRFVPSDPAAVTGARMFIGFRNATTTPTNVEPNTLLNTVGVCQLSTSNNLQMYCAGTAAQAAIDLGANFPASGLSTDAYILTLFASPNDGFINWRIEREGTAFITEGVFNGTAGTTIPGTTIGLAHAAWRTNNATLLACGLDIANVYIKN